MRDAIGITSEFKKDWTAWEAEIERLKTLPQTYEVTIKIDMLRYDLKHSHELLDDILRGKRES